MSSINEEIHKLELYANNLKQNAEDIALNISDEDAQKVRQIANRTIETLNSSIEKLKELSTSNIDEQQLNSFLERLDAKCKEIVDFAENKIDDYKPKIEENLNSFIDELQKNSEELKSSFKDDQKTLEDALNKILNNPNVKNATEILKQGTQKVSDFYHNDKTQTAINKMKIKTIEVAEKGLLGLKELLDRVDKENNSKD